MKILHLAIIAIMLMVTGCTNMYLHSFQVNPVEPLSQAELRNVFVKFKAHLSEQGMREVTPSSNTASDYAAFELGSGKSGILREPFEEYLELSYTPEKGFILKIVRIISHREDFSQQYISDFRTKTEQLIHEATSKKFHLQVINENERP